MRHKLVAEKPGATDRHRFGRDRPPKFPMPATRLIFCKENVVAVRSAYVEWRQQLRKLDRDRSNEIRQAIDSTWSLLRGSGALRLKLSPAQGPHEKGVPKQEWGWYLITENLFHQMIAAMERFGVLTVLDDSRVVRGTEGALQHALEGLIDGMVVDRSPRLIDNEIVEHDLAPHVLVGRYRVFQPSAIERDRILLGDLTIRKSSPNTVSLTLKQKVKGLNEPVALSGAIVRVDKIRCQAMLRGNRMLCDGRLNIAQFGVQGGRQFATKFTGWTKVDGVNDDDNYIRRTIVERVDDDSPEFTDLLGLDDPRIDPTYRPLLKREGNLMFLNAFTGWAGSDIQPAGTA